MATRIAINGFGRIGRLVARALLERTDHDFELVAINDLADTKSNAVLFGFVTPELLSWHESGNVLLMVILGGMGNLAGAIAGAFAFEAMREIFADITKYWQLLMGGVIVAVVLFLPGGLAGVPGRIKRALQGGEAK